MFTFFCVRLEILFQGKLSSKVQNDFLRLDFVHKLIQICGIPWWCSFFVVLDRKYLLLEKTFPNYQSLYKLFLSCLVWLWPVFILANYLRKCMKKILTKIILNLGAISYFYLTWVISEKFSLRDLKPVDFHI